MKLFKRQNWHSLVVNANLARRLITVSALVLLSTIFFISEPVWAAPTILPSTLPEAEVGISYTTTLVAAPVTPPCTWTITSGSLPNGLTLNATTGVISGTPTTTGSYAFFVEVADATSPPSSPQQGFLINVTQTPITFLTTTLPDADIKPSNFIRRPICDDMPP